MRTDAGTAVVRRAENGRGHTGLWLQLMCCATQLRRVPISEGTRGSDLGTRGDIPVR